MSEERVGDSVRRTKIARTITALLCAPPAGAFLATCIILVPIALTSSQPLFVGPTSATLTFALPIMYGAAVGWPAGLLVGWPVHALLQRGSIVSPLPYIALGGLIALIPPSALMGLNILRAPDIFVTPSGILVLAGAVAGLVFWLIRRPDRDAPANHRS